LAVVGKNILLVSVHVNKQPIDKNFFRLEEILEETRMNSHLI
jgi:hypothetical protein